MVQLKIDKEVKEIRFTTVIDEKGGRVILNIPHVKQFDQQLNERETEQAKYFVFRASEGAVTFGEAEPADLLGEAVAQVGVLEEQGDMIESLTKERDTAAKAASNSNDELNRVREELSVVRERLKESTNEANKLRDGLKDNLLKITALENDTKRLDTENGKLRQEVLEAKKPPPTPSEVKS